MSPMRINAQEIYGRVFLRPEISRKRGLGRDSAELKNSRAPYSPRKDLWERSERKSFQEEGGLEGALRNLK